MFLIIIFISILLIIIFFFLKLERIFGVVFKEVKEASSEFYS